MAPSFPVSGSGCAFVSAGLARHRRFWIAVAAAIAVALAGYAAWVVLVREDGGGRGAAASAQDVRQAESDLRDVARRMDELVMALGDLRSSVEGSAVFTEDATWSDWGIQFVGRDRVVDVQRAWALATGGIAYANTEFYVGRSGGVVGQATWNIRGWTKEKPGRWLFEYELRDDRIAAAILLADVWMMTSGNVPPGAMQPEPGVSAGITTLTREYASAWSSGDGDAVAGLYAADAVRRDLVFGDRQGLDEIEDLASELAASYPRARFTVVRAYGVGDPAVPGRPQIGAELAIRVRTSDGRSCAVKAAVYLETKAGAIARERVYYDADSLVACGWAR